MIMSVLLYVQLKQNRKRSAICNNFIKQCIGAQCRTDRQLRNNYKNRLRILKCSITPTLEYQELNQ